MIKYICILLGLTSLIYADALSYKTGFELSESKPKEKFIFFTKEEVKKMFNEEEFIKETGEKKENVSKMIETALKDEFFQNGLYYQYRLVYKEHVKTRSKEATVLVPAYDKSLENFAISTKRYQNVLSAYFGFKILEGKFMLFGRSSMTDTYMATFSELMMKKNYCKGYLYYGRTFMEKFGGNDINKANAIFKRGVGVCTASKEYYFYEKDMNLERVKTNYLKKSRAEQDANYNKNMR